MKKINDIIKKPNPTEYKFETTDNNTRTFLYQKGCECFVGKGKCLLEKHKSWTIDELLSFFKKLKGIKQVKSSGFYGCSSGEGGYRFLYETKKGDVSIVVSKGGEYGNKKYCPKISLQIPPENNSFQLMNELIEKANRRFKVNILSGILGNLVTIEELKSVKFKEAEEIGYKNFLVEHYLFLIHQNKHREAKKFIKGKITKSEFLKIKESLLKKDHIKFGYFDKLIKK